MRVNFRRSHPSNSFAHLSILMVAATKMRVSPPQFFVGAAPISYARFSAARAQSGARIVAVSL
jgi:hypothetical protein